MDEQLCSANGPSTSCTNMVNFGPVTPEIEARAAAAMINGKRGNTVTRLPLVFGAAMPLLVTN